MLGIYHAICPFTGRHPIALFALAGGRVGRGFMVKTVADRLGISFERAEAMAVAAAVAGLVRHEVHTLTLTGEGRSAECPVPQLEEGVGLHGRDRDVGLRATVI